MKYITETFSAGTGKRTQAAVTVCVSLYNYGLLVTNTLESVARQTLSDLSLIVVDDCSSDRGPGRVRQWMRSHPDRFVDLRLILKTRNRGLADTRNLAVHMAKSPYVFMLDADNLLYPRCVSRMLDVIRNSRAAMTYCLLERFGIEQGVMGMDLWSPDRLAQGNYIDAMTLLDRRILVVSGGFAKMPVPGWEDYDLWCRYAEMGLKCVRVPEILARYRVHRSSMIQTVNRQASKTRTMVRDMKWRHPWLKISA